MMILMTMMAMMMMTMMMMPNKMEMKMMLTMLEPTWYIASLPVQVHLNSSPSQAFLLP